MTHRPYGAGSLQHLEGDRYRYVVRHDGKRLSRVFRAKSATEANRVSATLRGELIEAHEHAKDAAGVERDVRQTWTVERYIAHYLEAWAPLHLENTTRARYASIFKHNVVPHIGKVRMTEVTPTVLTNLYATLRSPNARKRGGTGALSDSTVSTVRNVLRSLFTFAVEVNGDLPANPAASKAARPKLDTTPPRRRILDVGEVRSLVELAQAKAPHIAVPVMLSARLGTRRGETVGLRWSDVDFDAGTITVRRSVSYTQAAGLSVKSTKTGKHRTIPLDPHALAELKRVQLEQRARRMKFGPGWAGADSPVDDYIATEPNGAGFRPDAFGSYFRVFCEQHGVEGVTLHLLRHAWVSQMIALGFDAVTIAAMSGHSPDVLLKTYAHAFDSRKQEAMNALGDAWAAARAVE